MILGSITYKFIIYYEYNNLNRLNTSNLRTE